MNAREKYDTLLELLREYESVGVAFSGGVDSALLLHAAQKALGPEVVAFTATSPFFPKREDDEARAFCEQRGIAHKVIEVDQLSDPAIRANTPDRCYTCKRMLMGKLLEHMRAEGLRTLVEGSNMDDEDDYRPGMKAVEELGVKSPLRHVGLLKDEIRALSEEMGLPTWNKPAFACLATRFAFGDPLEKDRLAMVDAAEQVLVDLGFGQLRVRMHGSEARIELDPAEIERLREPQTLDLVKRRFAELGFSDVTVNPNGYQRGSMNVPVTQ